MLAFLFSILGWLFYIFPFILGVFIAGIITFILFLFIARKQAKLVVIFNINLLLIGLLLFILSSFFYLFFNF